MGTQEVSLPLPPAALLQRCAGEPHVFLLDGGGTASWTSGYALLGFGPRATLRVTADGAAVMWDGSTHRWDGHPFALLDRFCAMAGTPARGGPLPPRVPAGGTVVVALSYELRRWVERLPDRHAAVPSTPVLHAAWHDWHLSYAYASGQYHLTTTRSDAAARALCDRLRWLAATPAGRAPTESPLMLRRAQHERENARTGWNSAHPEFVEGRAEFRPQTSRRTRTAARSRIRSDLSRAEYCSAVRAALAYIAAGDVYQVNLAQRFTIVDPPAPVAVFARLQRRHPMPFAAYVDGGDFVLVSNSPECFLTRRGMQVATFPIKGTRPRGETAAADAALRAELCASSKDQAEHVMIVDLERNDLGRVCRVGTVTVPDLAVLHSFPSVHHLVSEVRGELRAGTSVGDLLRATFPGGSITGAPKIRAMEIIDQVEPVARGFYTGAIGFVTPGTGDLVLNLAIRTGVATAGAFTYHAGGGIVADSDPEREYEETLVKSRAFLAALEAEGQ